MEGLLTSEDLTSTVMGQLPAPGTDPSRLGGGPQTFAPDMVQDEESAALADMVYRDLAQASPKIELWRHESHKSFRYYDLDQWDELDRMAMEQLRRPTLVFDRIQAIVNAVAGMEKLNRKIARINPTALDSDPQLDIAGELASEAIEYDLEMVQGYEERSLAVLDTLIGGMGWYSLYPDYERNAEPGVIALEHYSPFDAYWDVGARQTNLRDSNWRARRQNFSPKKFRQRWPDAVDAVENARVYYTEQNIGRYELVYPWYSRANEEANPQVSELTTRQGEIPVYQYQRRIQARYWRFYDPRTPDQLKEVSDEEWQFLIRRIRQLGGEPPEAVAILKPRIQQLMVARGVLLEPPLMLKCNDFTLRCITGKWHTSKKFWYGMVRSMIDGQQTRNKAISSALGFHLTNARGGVMYETDAFEDPEMAKQQWSSYDAWIELREGGAQKVIQRQNTQMPPELTAFFAEGTKAITEASGVSEEILGMASQDISSPTVHKRVVAALSSLGWFWDSVLLARREEARCMLELIREYWTNGQLIQIGGVLESQSIPLLSKFLPLSYTVQLDDSVRYSPDARAQVWDDIKPFFGAILKMPGGAGLAMKFLKFSRIPPLLIQEAQQYLAQNPQVGQRQPRGKQDPPELVQAKVAKLSADAQRALAQAQELERNHGVELTRLLMEGAADREERIHQRVLDAHRILQDRGRVRQEGPFHGQT